MRINTTGWLNYITALVIACTSYQTLASDALHEEKDVTLSSRRYEITHLEDFDVIKKDSVLVRKLDKICMHLFFPITLNVNKEHSDHFRSNRKKFQDLLDNLLYESEIQSISWTQFHADFIASKRLISDYMAKPKTQSQITYPLFADKFNDLLKCDIDTISLNNFCQYIVEFDYTLRKAFLTKPPQEGKLSCEECGEQEIECTKFLGQHMLECNFCNHAQYLY